MNANHAMYILNVYQNFKRKNQLQQKLEFGYL